MKFMPGPLAGMLSGSVGATVASRNRYGAYFRERAVPVNPGTVYTEDAKARFAAISQAWVSESENTRNAWQTWAQTHPIIDRIGQSQVLSGNAAFQMLQNRQILQGGSPLSGPPVEGPPNGLLTLTGTADIGAGDFELVFTPTPVGANNRLWVWAAVVSSGSVNFVKNLYKLVYISPLNQATDVDTSAEIIERFGSLTAGQWIHFLAVVSSNVTGLQSIGKPLKLQVVST